MFKEMIFWMPVLPSDNLACEFTSLRHGSTTRLPLLSEIKVIIIITENKA